MRILSRGAARSRGIPHGFLFAVPQEVRHREVCMSIRIEQPGALSTVQDMGRFGYLASGVTESGAMDREALAEADRIVGNETGAAGIEMTLMGLSAVFDSDGVIALTGADMGARLDGEPVPRYSAVSVRSGETLTCGMASEGCRAYLAVRGGIDVPVVMGSRSTNLRSHMGGFEGRALQAGDELPVGHVAAAEDGNTPGACGEAEIHLPHYSHEVTVRVVPGPQDEAFTEQGKHTFFHSTYTVKPESDRMGMRLTGDKIESCGGVDIISDGILFGSVQITNGGEPIIMMADHQTTGGYAKIATVCSFDLPKLSQLVPGDRVNFEEVSLERARQLLLHPEERNRSEKPMLLSFGRRGSGEAGTAGDSGSAGAGRHGWGRHRESGIFGHGRRI